MAKPNGPPSAETLKHFREVFDMFDKDKSGTISCSELRAITNALSMNLSEPQLKKMIAAADKNGDSVLSFDEFVTVLNNTSTRVFNDAMLLSAFQQYDANGDGHITGRELREAMRKVGEDLTDDEITSMMKAADQDGDGVVDYKEFVRLMGGGK
jgi:calmodulin